MTDIIRIGEGGFGGAGVLAGPSAPPAPIPQGFNTNYKVVPGFNRMLVLGVSCWASSAPVLTFSWGGIDLTELSFEKSTTLYQGIFYMLESDIASIGAVGPSYQEPIALNYTGGANLQMVAVFDLAKNVVQGVPSFEYNSEVNQSVIATDIDSGVNTWSFAVNNRNDDGATWTHNNAQNEVYDGPFSPAIPLVGSSATSTIYTSSTASQFTATMSGATAGRLQRTHVVFEEEESTIVEMAAQVSAISEVDAIFTNLNFFAATLAATSTVDPHEFLYRREFATTVVSASVVSAFFERAVDFTGDLDAVSALTVQPIMRTVDWEANVAALAEPTGVFNATRPLAAEVDAELVVTPTFGNDFGENFTSLTPGCYVELFEIDTTIIGGGDIFRFIPGGYEVSEVQWRGEEYIRFPVSVEGFEWNATSQAPPQPELRLSNVNKFVLAAVITLGDLVGAKVTRWRTYAQYLDDGELADSNAHFPPDIFYVQQKTTHSKEFITWVLSSALDLPGVRLPKRQVLRDETTGNVYAPGVSKVRFKGR